MTDDPLRAITVQQPWAWAIATGHKPIENRGDNRWPLGTYAVHAGRRWSRRGAHDERMVDALLDEARADLADQLTDAGSPPTPAADLVDRDRLRVDLVRRGLPRTDVARFTPGAVIGIVRLVEVHHDGGCCRPWGESLYAEGAGRIRTDVWHLVLEGAVELDHPVPCRGQLGPWRLPADVHRRVLEVATA